ncbi:aldose 1-epimerase family protein [Microbacterium sp. Se5.02b]|nr:aldose 1-epimerase family protein [Microbacterium sp. Se5.02b]
MAARAGWGCGKGRSMSAELYGSPIAEAWRRLGHRGQAVSVESSRRTDGPDAGSRRIRVVNGDLELEILPDRGLDLGQFRVAGIPLAWTSPTGFPPVPADPDGRGWLRAFGVGCSRPAACSASAPLRSIRASRTRCTVGTRRSPHR